MKPADILRRIAPVGTMGAHERVCADLLDECERVLAGAVEAWDRNYVKFPLDEAAEDDEFGAIQRARATLAKLRGEQ